MNNSEQPNLEHSWRFFNRPQDTWDAMYQDCLNAQCSIEFEQYILENDEVGRRFMELFIEKAKSGLKVFLICDTFGSALLTRSSLVRRLRRHGGRLHFYNVVTRGMIFLPWRWFPRTHTKTLLIDSSIAYTGGVCIAQRMQHWRDTHIRVTGPVIAQVRQAFDEIETRILRKKNIVSAQPENISAFRYLLNRPRKNDHPIYRVMESAIESAKDYIYITSAFFIPNRHFLKLLKKASARGVDVRILVPECSDVMLADWVCLSYTKRFFAMGFRIYHYQPTVLHSKTAIIDDRWGTVGSTNFDIISFFHNREANIITTDMDAIAAMKQQFFTDLEKSSELTPAKWKVIPLWKKTAGYALRIFKVFF